MFIAHSVVHIQNPGSNHFKRKLRITYNETESGVSLGKTQRKKRQEILINPTLTVAEKARLYGLVMRSYKNKP